MMARPGRPWYIHSMQPFRPFRRSLLLLLCLLPACGAAEFPSSASAGPAPPLAEGMVSTGPTVVAQAPVPRRRAPVPPGSAALLTARFAASQGDLDTAAQAYQRALAADMTN
jgi:hypothetical protein